MWGSRLRVWGLGVITALVVTVKVLFAVCATVAVCGGIWWLEERGEL